MLVTMEFQHQSDVFLSLSYCMVGSSNTNLLCFLFSAIQGGGFFISGGQTRLTSCTISGNTAVSIRSILNAREDGISPSK